MAFLNTLCNHHFEKQSSLHIVHIVQSCYDEMIWGQVHKIKLTCCELYLGLIGHLPSGLAQRVVTIQIMSFAQALISADGINCMKPLPLCLPCRRLRGTAVLFYTRSWHSLCLRVVKQNVNIWMCDVLWLLTWVSWAHRSVTSDFDTYYLSASGCFLFLCLISFDSAPAVSY